MQRERRSVDLDWGPVSYLTWGDHTGCPCPTVVLLHGGGVDSASLSWGSLGAALADASYHVIVPDHPGYGESPLPPWPAGQDRLVAYVGEFLDALGLEMVVLGGLSLGGGLTLGYTLEHPERVEGAILMGSYGLADHQYAGPAAGAAHALSWALVRTGAMGRILRGAAADRRLMKASLREIIRTPERLTPALVDEVIAAATRPGAMTSFEQWQRDQITWGRLRTNYAPRLGEVTVPTLVVHGTRDSGVPVSFARQAVRRLPNATACIVEGAGHWVQRDRPDVVEPAVLEFMNRLPRAGVSS